MKFFGEKINPPDPEIVVIPRSDKDIVFKCGPVLDYSEFEKVCPAPKPPMIRRRGVTELIPDTADKRFQAKLSKHADRRVNWMLLKSLEATDGLEWELVKMTKPDTWDKLEEELQMSGFSVLEINYILQGCYDANGMNEDKMQKARDRFFAEGR